MDDKYRSVLAGMFSDSRFREFKKFCYIGNVDGAKLGVVLATKTPKYDNFALGKASVERMMASKRSGKLTEAFVVAASVDISGVPTFVAFREAEEFYTTLLRKRSPRGSEYGEFWVLTDYMITNSAAGEEEDEF